MRRLVWRRVDRPGTEIAHAESLERASGTQIGVAYELRWGLDGTGLELEVVGGRRLTVDLGDADFFDVFASPFFNSLPVAQDRLLGGGEARTYTMRFVRVPELEAVSSEQRYEPLGDGWIAPRVEIYTDGRLVMTEDYHDMRPGVDIAPGTFSPVGAPAVHWWE